MELSNMQEIPPMRFVVNPTFCFDLIALFVGSLHICLN